MAAAPKNRKAAAGVGFARSDKKTITIPAGQTGVGLEADLGTNYAYVIIRCEDTTRVQAATTFGLKVGMDDNDTLVQLHSKDNTGAFASGTLPTTGGTFQQVILSAFGVQRVQIILSNAASGGNVVFDVYGVGQAVAG